MGDALFSSYSQSPLTSRERQEGLKDERVIRAFNDVRRENEKGSREGGQEGEKVYSLWLGLPEIMERLTRALHRS